MSWLVSLVQRFEAALRRGFKSNGAGAAASSQSLGTVIAPAPAVPNPGAFVPFLAPPAPKPAPRPPPAVPKKPAAPAPPPDIGQIAVNTAEQVEQSQANKIIPGLGTAIGVADQVIAASPLPDPVKAVASAIVDPVKLVQLQWAIASGVASAIAGALSSIFGSGITPEEILHNQQLFAQLSAMVGPDQAAKVDLIMKTSASGNGVNTPGRKIAIP